MQRMREKKTEKLRISADISIPAALHLADEVSLPILGSCNYPPNETVCYTLHSISPASATNPGSTRFAVAWEIVADLPKDLTEEDLSQIVDFAHRGNGQTFISKFNFNCPALYYPGHMLYNYLIDAVWKLVFASRDVRFLQGLNVKSMAQHVGHLTITCMKMKVTEAIPETAWLRLGDGLSHSVKLLTQPEIQICLSTPLDDVERNCVLSGIEYSRIRFDTAVVLLATMLETESYKAAKRILQIGDTEDFSPRKYFGDGGLDKRGVVKGNYLGAKDPLYQSIPDCYKSCHELWGARHEIVHNGQNMVREFNGGHGVDKNMRREITGQDIWNFRQASLNAITWMKGLN